MFFDLNRNKKSLTLNLKAMVLEHHHPTGGHWRLLGFPLRLSEAPVDIHHPAPALGKHTEALLTGLGYSPRRIEKLRRDQVLLDLRWTLSRPAQQSCFSLRDR